MSITQRRALTRIKRKAARNSRHWVAVAPLPRDMHGPHMARYTGQMAVPAGVTPDPRTVPVEDPFGRQIHMQMDLLDHERSITDPSEIWMLPQSERPAFRFVKFYYDKLVTAIVRGSHFGVLVAGDLQVIDLTRPRPIGEIEMFRQGVLVFAKGTRETPSIDLHDLGKVAAQAHSDSGTEAPADLRLSA